MSIYNNIIKKLINKKITVSVAESCTGGLLSMKFTEISGSSKIFNTGLITYSDFAKYKFLNIAKSNIIKNGAVSEKIAILMVKNLFKITKSNLCISVTGIAGPTGATKTKPIGLVYICIKFNNELLLFEKKFIGVRKNIQNNVVKFCFNEIKKLI